MPGGHKKKVYGSKRKKKHDDKTGNSRVSICFRKLSRFIYVCSHLPLPQYLNGIDLSMYVCTLFRVDSIKNGDHNAAGIVYVPLFGFFL